MNYQIYLNISEAYLFSVIAKQALKICIVERENLTETKEQKIRKSQLHTPNHPPRTPHAILTSFNAGEGENFRFFSMFAAERTKLYKFLTASSSFKETPAAC